MDEKSFNLFIFVYKIIRFIILLPIYMVKYFFTGFYFISSKIINILLYVIVFVSLIFYKIIKYIILCFTFPVVIYNILTKKKNAIEDDSLKEKLVSISENEKIVKPSAYDLTKSLAESQIIDEAIDISNITDFSSVKTENMNQTEVIYSNQTDSYMPDMIDISEGTTESVIKKKEMQTSGLVLIMKKVFEYVWFIMMIMSFPVYKLFKYVAFGIVYASFIISKICMYISFPIYKLFKYFAYGFIFVSYIIQKIFVYLSFIQYKVVKYLLLSFSLPIILLNVLGRVVERKNKRKEETRLKREEQKFKKQLEYQKKQEEKLRITLEKKQKKEKQNEEYINENVKIEKQTFGQKFNEFLDKIFAFPSVLAKKIKSAYENSVFVKNYKNKKDINRQALLIDFESDDAQKSDVKLVYEYTAKSPEGKIVTDHFEAYSKVEVHSFLLSEGYEVYNIKTNKWIQTLYGSVSVSKEKMKTKDLIFFLNQLSTYLKAGITLVESLKILCRQYEKQKKYQKLFRTIIYDLSTGESFSSALGKQGNAFPRILINMIRASEMTGELPEALDDMANYFTEMDKTKKQMITALTYPVIILVVAIAVVVFILLFVIPRFVSIYETIDASKIPKFTLMILALSEFLKNNYLYLLLGVIMFILIFVYLYKNVKAFRTIIQWILMHTPVFGNVIIYNEVTIFTKTFSSLLSHNVFITDSMEILNKVTGNEIYKMLILDTITNLAKGEKISESFKDHWAFPIPAYEMLVTGERTGQLPEMMAKVSDYYQELHRNSVTRIKTFIEPVLILFLTGIVGAIVLAIVVPMFGMYESVQNIGQ